MKLFILRNLDMSHVDWILIEIICNLKSFGSQYLQNSSKI